MQTSLRSNLQLTSAVEFFKFKALAVSTRNSYASGVKAFVNFVLMSGAGYFNHSGLPDRPSEELFMYFVSHCATVLNLSVKTIKLYLSGIRNAYIEGGFGDPFKIHNVPMLQLQQVLRGIKKCEPQTTRPRLPITFEILSSFIDIMNRGFFGQYIDALMKAACCVAFFGFLRCGEFTTTSSQFDASCGLSRADISFNNVAEASVTQMRICLKASKTDPFRQGTVIKLFKIQGHTCPVTTSIAFLHQPDCNSRLHPYSSPLFAMPNGEPLTRKSFINMLNQLCMASGLNPNLYSGHSLRIGAATSAAKRAVADHLIQVLGRWKSDCYKVYIRTSNETLHSAHIAMSRA